MSLLNLLFRNLTRGAGLPSQVGLLTLDVTIEESHEFGARVTDFPVEGGGLVSDHVHLEPKSLTITGFVTDTPLVFRGFSLGMSRAASAFYILEDMWQARIPFVVVSQLRVYRNMVIESLIIPKSREQAIRFTCTMREITFVYGQNTLIPTGSENSVASPAISKNGGGVGALAPDNVDQYTRDTVGLDAGRQIATNVTPVVEENASILYGIFN
jgi:hypothetical protein